MKYRRFGKTEIKMPVISVGGMRFQTSWKREDPVKPEHVKNLEKIVAHAVASGLNHFETAHGYGTSEEELGPVLAQYDRNQLIVQTKVGPAETVKEFLDNLETSMRCLKVDRLDLFAIHGINNNDICDQVMQKDGVLDAALKLKCEGVLGAVFPRMPRRNPSSARFKRTHSIISISGIHTSTPSMPLPSPRPHGMTWAYLLSHPMTRAACFTIRRKSWCS